MSLKDKVRLYRLLRVLTCHIDNVICCGEWKHINNYSKTYIGYSKRVLGTCIVVAFRSEDESDRYPYELMVCLGMENDNRKKFSIDVSKFNKDIDSILAEAVEYIDSELK